METGARIESNRLAVLAAEVKDKLAASTTAGGPRSTSLWPPH